MMKPAVVPLLLVVVVACAPQVSEQEEKHPTVEEPATSESVAAEGDDCEEFQARVLELEAENQQLLAERDEALAEVERQRQIAETHQQGLEEAVDELNRVASASTPRGAPGLSPPSAAASKARVTTLGAPRTTIVGDEIVVSGKLWNMGDGDADVELTIDLVNGEDVVDTAVLNLPVASRTDVSYRHVFFVGSPEGAYSARVRMRY